MRFHGNCDTIFICLRRCRNGYSSKYNETNWVMGMRKVALITDGWRRLFTYAWPAGILQRIRETGEDVIDCVDKTALAQGQLQVKRLIDHAATPVFGW